MNKIGVKNVDIESLIPNPRNPRQIESSVGPVAKSIEEFGFLVPMVINEKNVVLSGHARLAAAKSLGLDKVPVIVAKGLTKEQETAFMLADNRLSENASYNTEQLSDLLKELTDASYDVLQTGFNEEEIEAFITSSTAELDDILGLSDSDDDEGEVLGEEDEESDMRHLHRMVFLMTPDQKSAVLEAIDVTKKSSEAKLSNGEALTVICMRGTETCT